MRQRLLSIAFATLLCANLSGCFSQSGNEKSDIEKKTSTEQQDTSKYKIVPYFDPDSAYQFIAMQCAYGPRVPNLKQHDECGNALQKALEKYGLTTEKQEFKAKAFDGTTLNGTNIIGRFHAERTNRIVLFSHWDSRPFSDKEKDEANRKKPVMGANDGASGVGVLLELARQTQRVDPGIGVDIVFLDLEDYGAPEWANFDGNDDWCLGSQYWSLHHNYTSENRPRMGILLDMVGGENPTFLIDVVSSMFANSRAERFWKNAYELGYSSTFVSGTGGEILDDHYYVNNIAQIPTFDIIDYRPGQGFPESWHTQHDDMAHISKKTLGIVGKVLTRFVYTSCGNN